MISYLLMIAAVVVFIGGIVYYIKGLREETPSLLSRPDHGAVVPGTLVAAKPVELSRIPDNTELLQTRVTGLEQELHALQDRAAARAAADQQAIAGLTQENGKFKKQIEQRESESGRLAAQVEEMRLLCDRLKAEEDAKIQDFRQEITRMDLLTKELGEARDGALNQQTHWQAEREQLTAEHANLLAQAGEHERQMQRLQKDIELMQKVNNQKLNEASDMARLLEAQKSESDRIQEEVLGKQLAQALEKVGEFNQERDHLIQARVALEQNLGKTRDFNAYLLEKEKVLQYELTKQRAQALGLEKICEDFKIQIDDLTKAAVAN
ncbi:MAG: hypothetical protein HZA29_01550 [Candidatus Omnitrophica bacterium]|nr:hypothetical protein [Candidatus Omnitrophota bacterium]